MKEALCFDDLLLVPKFSTISSRKEIDVSVTLPKIGTRITSPIVVANMKTVMGQDMAAEIVQSGGLALLHRFDPVPQQITIWNNLLRTFGDERVKKHVGFSIGVKEQDYSNLPILTDILGVRILNVDVAHGDSEVCHRMVAHIAQNHPEICLIAGNVATKTAGKSLWRLGADAVRFGIGQGSICSTRIETGNGVPTMTTLIDAHEGRKELISEGITGKLIMNDGGARSAGDIVKALCFADLQMCGNLFAGCKETPTQDLVIDGQVFRSYVGSSTHKTNHIEGVAALVHAKGSYQEVLGRLLEGLRSGCSYQGAANLDELKQDPEFVRISGAGLRESHPHDVILK